MRTRGISIVILVVLAAGGLSGLAEAAGCDQYAAPYPPSNFFARFGRGLVHMAVSPFEIPATMKRIAAERDPFFGLWAGGLEGVGNGVSRFLAGSMELLTSPIGGRSLPLYSKRLGERASPPIGVPQGITRP